MGKIMKKSGIIIVLIILAFAVYGSLHQEDEKAINEIHTGKTENEPIDEVHTENEAIDKANTKKKETESNIIIQYKEERPDSSGTVETVTVSKDELDNSLDYYQNKQGVIHVEEDVEIEIHGEPNDKLFSEQWYLDKIGARDAWTKATDAQETVTVAVVDSGIDENHRDLKGKILPGYNFIDENTDVTDENGHGTAISGIIAAIYNNQIGITGVAGHADVKILPLKVATEEGKGKVSDMIKAVDYAVDNKVDIINISMGATQHSQILENAVKRAEDEGIVVVASARNEGNNSYIYPASYDAVLSIGSISQRNTLSSFSNYNDQVNFVAPGEYMLSTSIGDSYYYFNGTSFSSAVVSGAAAFMLAADPKLDHRGVAENLEETVRDLGPAGKDDKYGHGLVNLADAIQSSEPEPPAAIEFEEDSLTLTVGKTYELKPEATPSSGDVGSFTWESSDPNIATVDQTGVIRAVGPGKATITVRTSAGDLSASLTVTVTKPASIPEKYKELEELQITGNDFYLQIKFTTGIDPESIDSNSVYILNEADEKLDVEYDFESNFEKVNVITPSSNYEMGEPYYLYVEEEVKSTAGEKLVQPIVIQFMWTEEEGVLQQQMIQPEEAK